MFGSFEAGGYHGVPRGRFVWEHQGAREGSQGDALFGSFEAVRYHGDALFGSFGAGGYHGDALFGSISNQNALLTGVPKLYVPMTLSPGSHGDALFGGFGAGGYHGDALFGSISNQNAFVNRCSQTIRPYDSVPRAPGFPDYTSPWLPRPCGSLPDLTPKTKKGQATHHHGSPIHSRYLFLYSMLLLSLQMR